MIHPIQQDSGRTLSDIDLNNASQVAAAISQAQVANAMAQVDESNYLNGGYNSDFSGTYDSDSNTVFQRSAPEWSNWLAQGVTIAIGTIAYNRKDIFDALSESHKKYSGPGERPTGETVATGKIVGKQFVYDEEAKNPKLQSSEHWQRMKEHLQGQKAEDIINEEKKHNKNFAKALENAGKDPAQAERVGGMVFDAASKKAGEHGKNPEELKRLRSDYVKRFREAHHFVHENYDKPKPEAAQKLEYSGHQPDHAQLREYGVPQPMKAPAPAQEVEAKTTTIHMPPQPSRIPAFKASPF